MKNFRGLVVREKDEKIEYNLEDLTLDNLSEGEVIIKVRYSSINFKDMLAIKKNGGVIRNYPMIPGIDLSGVVVSSLDDRYREGDEVIVTGYKMGMSHTGGFSEYARVPAEWVIPLPKGISLKESMIMGTAGLTAILSINKLEKMGMNKESKILVTGASGGVGSIAVQILLKKGYNNISVLTRKKVEELKKYGVKEVLTLEDLFSDETKKKPLQKPKFDYVLDNVGGEIASNIIPQIAYGGSMSMCGNANGIKLSTTVLPFILRGINILGIDSVEIDRELKKRSWEELAHYTDVFEKFPYREVKLEEMKGIFEKLESGEHIGRTIVKI